MADRAPGYEQAAEDLQCYNCGMRGHMFFACPEDTRRVPACVVPFSMPFIVYALKTTTYLSSRLL